MTPTPAPTANRNEVVQVPRALLESIRDSSTCPHARGFAEGALSTPPAPTEAPYKPIAVIDVACVIAMNRVSTLSTPIARELAQRQADNLVAARGVLQELIDACRNRDAERARIDDLLENDREPNDFDYSAELAVESEEAEARYRAALAACEGSK